MIQDYSVPLEIVNVLIVITFLPCIETQIQVLFIWYSNVKAMVFPVVMYGCESWTIKKAKPRRNDAFELWCWRRLLRVPWTAGRSNQSILKEISPEYSLEGLMWRTDSLEKTLMLGKIEGRRRRGWQRMRWLDGISDSKDMSLNNLGSWWWTGRPSGRQWRTEEPGVLLSKGSHGHDVATDQQQ